MVHEAETGNYPTYAKARDLVDEPVTILGADFREGRFGPEIVYHLRHADGSAVSVSLSRRAFRERGLQRIWTALKDQPDGVRAKLIVLEGGRDGTEADKVYLWDPFEVGHQASPERLAWEQAQHTPNRNLAAQIADDEADEDDEEAAARGVDRDPGPSQSDAPDAVAF
ncbi:MAG: hypothetical protein ACRENY_02355 [Candidatus Dormibacteria bacterium]